MAITSCGSLIEALRRHELLDAGQVAQVIRAARLPSSTPRSLARAMLQRGWLTVFQINQILAGHGRDLVIGPYHVLDRLGQGGQSVVFKARHTQHGWIVALKVIRAELLAHEDARQQFLREMGAMAGLNHENIVQFCDAHRAGGTYYCAMEYVDGTDLGKVVGLVGPLPVAHAADYIRQAALGLQHAHEHNLVHRDIKPATFISLDRKAGTAARSSRFWTGAWQACARPEPSWRKPPGKTWARACSARPIISRRSRRRTPRQ
jgi:hypothetical protein